MCRIFKFTLIFQMFRYKVRRRGKRRGGWDIRQGLRWLRKVKNLEKTANGNTKVYYTNNTVND